MPRSPLAPISTADEVRPAAPMSWMAMTQPVAMSLQAGLEQQLLGERVADLHGRALLLGVLVELGRGHGRAVDAVAAGLGAEIDDRHCRRRSPRRRRSCRSRRGRRHGVDQDVAVVAAVEVDLAADRRHAERSCRSRRCRRPRRRRDGGSSDGSGSPKRSALRQAIGRAPMVKTSRRMPPTPVAAPW